MLVVYDLSTGAVMAMQSTKDSSVETVGAVVQTLETWGHTDVVLHADGELATKSLVRSIAMLEYIELCQDMDHLTVIKAKDPSKLVFRFTVGYLWRTNWLWKLESVVVYC